MGKCEEFLATGAKAMSGRAAGKGNGEVVLGLLAMAEAAWTEAVEHGVPPLEA